MDKQRLTILITGGTGTLGTPLTRLLRERGHTATVLSRTAGPDRATGDLLSGAGIAEAVAGADVIVHCASGGRDAAATRTLIDAARSSGSPHLVYISIVGVDRIPFGYYKTKRECELLVERSGLPHTILRATQFHNFIDSFLGAQRFSPVTFALSCSFQPIDVRGVAARLAELAEGDPAGRVEDLGGPEVHTMKELAHQWRDAHGSSKAVWPLRLPGATFRSLRAGDNLTPHAAAGTQTFAEYLRAG